MVASSARPSFLSLAKHQHQNTESFHRRNLNEQVATRPLHINTLSYKSKDDISLSEQFTRIWHQLKMLHYRFEVTFGAYVMDTNEKIVFYIFWLLIFAAMTLLMYYPITMLTRQIFKSEMSTDIEEAERYILWSLLGNWGKEITTGRFATGGELEMVLMDTAMDCLGAGSTGCAVGNRSL